MEKISSANENSSLIIKKSEKASIAQNLLNIAGITINGSRPYDIQVHDARLFARVFKDGALGLGEAYLEKWWDCEALDVFFEKILRARLDTEVSNSWRYHFLKFIAKHINLQTKNRAKCIAEKHYDLGNELFECMLDKEMLYSCGYWQHADHLDAAQQAKMDLICRKLQLKPGLRLLDIGCGWGGFAKFAAKNYGVEVVGITISKQQSEYAKKICSHLPIEIRMQDYRDIHENFDRIVSIGMFEHVGHMNYQTFMQTIKHALKPNGLFLLHTIGVNEPYTLPNEWIAKYIFPVGTLPTIAQIAKASEKLFVVEDWHNFGADYDKTLMAWHKNFNANWEKLKNNIYDERFFRMWNYYLLSCAGTFRARTNQLWQIVFSHLGVPNGYQSIR